MCRRLLASFGLSLFASLVLAQTQDQQKCNITGTVVNSATGEPVPRAMVQMNGRDHRVAMSGNDGRFEMDDVVAGQAFIVAQRPGFSADQSQQQSVTVAEGMDSLVIKLNPLSRISGQVVDSDGEPIDGISVQCWREFINNGRRQWQQANTAIADETGRYLIEDVQPGVYVIRTQQRPMYISVPQKSEASRYVYPATYYPDANSRDLAQRVEVGSGQDVKADMSIRAVRAAHISLITVPAFPFVMASITDGDEQGEQNFARLNKATGILTLPAVPPGSWTIVVRNPIERTIDGRPAMYGELPVQVGSADIDNLKVPLYALQDIPVIESGGSSNVRLAADNGPTGYGAMSQNGEAKLMNVQPGTYRVTANPTAKGCITSVTAGSQNLLREELVVAAGASAPPIQVVHSENCPTLTVKVNSKASAFIIVTNFQQSFEPQPRSVSNQSTTFSNLAPGAYSVFAFDDISDLEYANPEAMRNFKGQIVQLEAGQETSVQLDLNERLAK